MGAAEPACPQVMKTKKDFLFPNTFTIILFLIAIPYSGMPTAIMVLSLLSFSCVKNQNFGQSKFFVGVSE
jgi:hypothetical protein